MPDDDEQPDLRNPARRLFDILDRWKVTPSNASVVDHRGGQSEWWPNHLEAIELLNLVEARVSQLSASSGQQLMFDSAIERIRAGIFSVTAQMDAAVNGQRTHLDNSDLTALQLIAATWQAGPPVNVDAVRGLLEVTAEAHDFVIAADELDNDAKMYLLELIKALQTACDSIAVKGTADVRALADQLAGALATNFNGTAYEKKAEGFFHGIVKWGQQIVFVDYVGAVAGGLGGATAQWAIGSGGQ